MPTSSVRHCFFQDAILDPIFDGIIWFSFLALNNLVTCIGILCICLIFPAKVKSHRRQNLTHLYLPMLCYVASLMPCTQ